MIQQAKKENNYNKEISHKEVKIVDVNSLMPFGAEVAVFNGYENNANVSFFIVCFSPGMGPRKHRHPYEETFIILEGAIEAVIEDKTYTVPAGNIMIVPPNTWHEFSNKTDKQVMTVNIHPAAEMVTEWYCD
jgi:quercetin dioxygenase-like cupin family protein